MACARGVFMFGVGALVAAGFACSGAGGRGKASKVGALSGGAGTDGPGPAGPPPAVAMPGASGANEAATPKPAAGGSPARLDGLPGKVPGSMAGRARDRGEAGGMEGRSETDPFVAARWSMMGYDARNNYHNPMETRLSVDNASQLEVKWTFEVAGYPPGTPVIGEGKVFVLATGGLYAIDFVSGAEVWHNAMLAGTSSVAYLDGALYVHTGAGAEVYKVNAADGQVIWGPVRSYERTGADGTSSPIVANGKVYVGHSTSLEVIDSGGAQAEARGGVRALFTDDGSDAWHYFTTNLPENGAMVWSSVAADEHAVYATTGNNYTVGGPNSDAIHSVADVDGSRLWASQVRADDLWVATDFALIRNPDTDFGANPILASLGDRQVVAAGDKAGDFWVMNRSDGSILWSRANLSAGSSQATGGILNNGAFDGKAFYVLANEPPAASVLVGMNAVDGTDLWPPKRFGLVTFGLVSVANGVLAAAVGNEVHLYNAATGEELKMFTTGGTIAAGAPAIAGGRVVVASGLRYTLQRSVVNNNEVICYGLPGDDEGSATGTQPAETSSGGDQSLAPTWTAIWEGIIVGTGCNGGAFCHAGNVGGLTMVDKDVSYAALVGVAAMGTNTTGTNDNCADTGLTRVAPGDPEGSLLIHKLDGTHTCGTQMPPGALLSQMQRDQVRTWITRGAAND
ncbi:MAG: PQQ-binding-like beta-propeller repeat protein [Myxococcales bacterium]|nr:PQQ-binding-like beta-propeller repeat protein [Myxococcales bacterium]